MSSGISQASAPDLARSLEALGAVLQGTQAQASQLAEKLLKAGIQQAIQDTTLGTLIDTSA
jgi:hypothetical protein